MNPHMTVEKCPRCDGATAPEIEFEAMGAFCEACELFRCGYCNQWLNMWASGGTDTIACDVCWAKMSPLQLEQTRRLKKLKFDAAFKMAEHH